MLTPRDLQTILDRLTAGEHSEADIEAPARPGHAASLRWSAGSGRWGAVGVRDAELRQLKAEERRGHLCKFE